MCYVCSWHELPLPIRLCAHITYRVTRLLNMPGSQAARVSPTVALTPSAPSLLSPFSPSLPTHTHPPFSLPPSHFLLSLLLPSLPNASNQERHNRAHKGRNMSDKEAQWSIKILSRKRYKRSTLSLSATNSSQHARSVRTQCNTHSTHFRQIRHISNIHPCDKTLTASSAHSKPMELSRGLFRTCRECVDAMYHLSRGGMLILQPTILPFSFCGGAGGGTISWVNIKLASVATHLPPYSLVPCQYINSSQSLLAV